jgi:NhaD family Na+/H+ antiporter
MNLFPRLFASPAFPLSIVFIVGYVFIIFEHLTRIHKSTIALLTAILLWVVLFAHVQDATGFLTHSLAEVSQVVFFLLGAMAIVEVINVHKGFNCISRLIRFESKRAVMWTLSAIAFVLSGIIDNLTTTIVMVAILRKIIDDRQDRWLMGGAIVIAANAGGAWTPIGDVTTTMLWIGGQLSSIHLMQGLFLPSLVCMIVSTLCLAWGVTGKIEKRDSVQDEVMEPSGLWILALGIGSLLFVPLFKQLTGLPPYMGILLGLAVLWLVTDLVHRRNEARNHLKMPEILTKIDLTSVIFFLGILLCIDALNAANLLNNLALLMDRWLPNHASIAVVIGIASAVVDNIPLVAASMGMYSLEVIPQDANFWQLIAYCAGTGGSMLIIGSAAGVVFMGLEKVDFFWYMRRISLPAAIGYFAGIGAYLLFA